MVGVSAVVAVADPKAVDVITLQCNESCKSVSQPFIFMVKTSDQVFSKERCRAYNLLTSEYVLASGGDSVPQKTQTAPARSTKAVPAGESPAYLQGDLDMYSPENQKRRKRLKKAKAIQVL